MAQTHNMPGMGKMPGMSDKNDAADKTSTADKAATGKGMDTPAPPMQEAGKAVMRESMLNMPILTPKRVWTVTGTEDWSLLRGFGAATGMVNMMNAMMVGGSPMQHMKMGKMDVAMAELPAPSPEEARTAAAPLAPVSAAKVGLTVTPDPPVVGDNALLFTVTDESGKPLTGLKPAASVAMVTMDMGTTHPPVMDMGGGHYQTTANFSMAGAWRIVVAADGGKVKQTFDLQAGGTQAQSAPAPAAVSAGPVTIAAVLASNPPKVGSANVLVVTLMDAQGKPVSGAKVSSAVAMTTMDMGTTHPTFQDKGNGRYEGKVGFSMAGPWRVTIHAVPPGGTPRTKAFDFVAG